MKVSEAEACFEQLVYVELSCPEILECLAALPRPAGWEWQGGQGAAGEVLHWAVGGALETL